jgi:hypothetical protein
MLENPGKSRWKLIGEFFLQLLFIFWREIMYLCAREGGGVPSILSDYFSQRHIQCFQVLSCSFHARQKRGKLCFCPCFRVSLPHVLRNEIAD